MAQIAQIFDDGFIEGGFNIFNNEFLPYFSHHQWLIHSARRISVLFYLKSIESELS